MSGAGEPLLLAGDVGGTKTVLALLAPDGSVVAEVTYPSRDFTGVEPMIARFRCAHPAPLCGIALSVAGPVIEGRTRITNLPWELDADRLRASLGVPCVRLVNDLQATANALPALGAGQILTLQPGVADPRGARAVIAVGTGLGEALLLPGAAGFLAVPTEGGHTDFAPRTRLQRALLAWLQRTYDHVSYERVCSGHGIPNIYRFLREHAGRPEPVWLAEAEDPTPHIVAAALAGRCDLCRRTVHVFAQILGAQAGNLALRALATGGVYLAGGIPHRLVPVLRGRAFAEGFLRKGPMSGVVARVPVHVVMDPRAALLGAARYGLTAAESQA